MATVVDTHRIDTLLDQLVAVWTAVPDVPTGVDAWDRDDQIDYVVEWPHYESKLIRLQQYVARGQLTAAQQARYDALVQLIQRNRPLRDELSR